MTLRLPVERSRFFHLPFSLLLAASFGLVSCSGDASVPSPRDSSSEGPVPTPTLPDDVPGLAAALSDPSSDVRRMAAEALGEKGDPAAAFPLLKELDDEDVHARKAAAEALGLVLEKAPAGTPGRPEAVDALIRLLGDPDYGVRYNSAAGLSHLRSRRAVPALVTVLERDPDEAVRSEAAWALGQTGDPVAVEPLVVALRKGRADEWKVCNALTEILGPKAADALVRRVREER